MSAFKRDWLAALLAVLGGVGAVLILLRVAPYGPALGTDAVGYIAVARNLIDGNGLVTYHGGAYQGGGPLFPLALAGIGLFGGDVIKAGAGVNAAAFGLTVFVVALWLKSRVQSRLLVIWAGSAYALTIPLAYEAARVMTDTLFILFVVISLFALDRFLGTSRRGPLLLAAASAGAACLTRYIGVTLLGSGLLILVFQRNAVFRVKMRAAAVWSVVAAVPFGVWVWRDVAVVRTVFSGESGSNDFSSLGALHDAGGEISRWMLGETGVSVLNGTVNSIAGIDATGPASLAAVVSKIAVLLLVVSGVGYALVRYRRGFFERNRTLLTVSLVFLSSYAMFLMLYLPVADIALPARFLVPMFPPLLVVVTTVLDEFLSNDRGERAGALKKTTTGKCGPRLVSLLVAIWLLMQLGPNYHDITSWREHGKGYGSKQWVNSELVRHLKTNLPDSLLFSTSAPMLYLLPDLQESREKIESLSRRFSQLKSRLFNARAAGEEAFVVVFYRDFWRRSYDYDLEDIGALPGLDVAAILEDGILFRSRVPSDTAAAIPKDGSVAGAFHTLLKDARLIIHAHFDLYLDVYHNRLVYVRDACGGGDTGYTGPRFFLHVFPVDPAELPGHRRRDAFDEFDFHFNHYGGSIGGRCIAVRSLPAYNVAAIRTGQFDRAGGELWREEFRFSD